MSTTTLKEKWIDAIRLAEKSFEKSVAERGIKAAFLDFADEHAVLNRANKIIKGKDAIADFFDAQSNRSIQLTWTPDHIDVSEDGTMAYTYGSYTYKAKTEEEKSVETKGIFHTVWKRQKDSSWKYVYD